MKGYKVFEPDWTCRGFRYEVGKTFEEDVTPVCCDRGFHFCKELKDCFYYYSFNSENKVAVIEALGDIDEQDGDLKCCTNKIHIVQELTWQEVLTLVNTGKDCTGLWNTGDWNTGDRNTRNRNTGNCNTGNCNTGNWNAGNYNTGNCNTGNRNTGDWNTGDWNTGNRNTGNCNAGNCNTGNCNTGNRNTGDRNTGNCNTGNCNTGNWNAGNCNTGDRNTGDRNTGDWNISSFNSGCFCTDEHEILIFDKPSGMSYKDWMNSDARYLLNQIPKNVVKWIYTEYMSDEEKEAHQTHETTGGYLKVLDESECGQIWWDGLSDRNKKVIKAIPNFNKDKFEKCTGIKVGEK